MLSFLNKLKFKSFIKRNFISNNISNNLGQSAFETNINPSFSKTYSPERPAKLITSRVKLLNSLGKKHKDIMTDSNLPKSTYTRIINDFTLNNLPKKENIIKLAIGLEFNLSQTKYILNSYGYTLTNSSKLDVTCKYFFANWKYKKNERGTGKGIYTFQLLLSEWSNINVMER